jgi:hypothetical protein
LLLPGPFKGKVPLSVEVLFATRLGRAIIIITATSSLGIPVNFPNPSSMAMCNDAARVLSWEMVSKTKEARDLIVAEQPNHMIYDPADSS